MVRLVKKSPDVWPSWCHRISRQPTKRKCLGVASRCSSSVGQRNFLHSDETSGQGAMISLDPQRLDTVTDIIEFHYTHDLDQLAEIDVAFTATCQQAIFIPAKWINMMSFCIRLSISTSSYNRIWCCMQYIRGRGLRLWNVDIRMSNGEWIGQKMGCVVFMQSVVFTVYDVGCRDANRTLPSSTPTRPTIQTLYTL